MGRRLAAQRAACARTCRGTSRCASPRSFAVDGAAMMARRPPGAQGGHHDIQAARILALSRSVEARSKRLFLVGAHPCRSDTAVHPFAFPHLESTPMPRHIVCLTFDFDTQSGFIARGMTTPTPLSRGEFGALASRRILAFLKSCGIAATWFTPGFTIESWPKECEAVLAGGHEIANHSWAHIPSATMTRAGEAAHPVRASEAIVRLTGRKPRGYRSASWDLSASTIDLLIAHGFVYDSSLMGGDYLPYRARRGDVAVLGKPYEFGAETSLIEMPISWSLDD